MSYRSPEPLRTTIGSSSAKKPYVPQYHFYQSEDSRMSSASPALSPAPSYSTVNSFDAADTPVDGRMPSVFAPEPSLHRAKSDQYQRAGLPATRPYSDYRGDAASVHSVSSTHSVPARYPRPLSSSSNTSAYGNRILPLPSPGASSTTPIPEHRRPPSFLDNIPASSQRFSTLSDPDFFRLRISDSPRNSHHDEPPIHLPPIISSETRSLSRKRSSSSITSAYPHEPPTKAKSIRSFQSSFDERSSLTSSYDRGSNADPLDYSLPQGWSGPSEPRKVGRSSAAAARIMQRRMKKNQLDSPAMGIEDELAKTDIEEDSLKYVFVVVQQPVRARACGFGDKDRRPLSPTPIIKCIVYDRQGRIVDPMDVQVHQLVMTMDLWDETGMHERNLIVHPTPGGAVTPHHPTTPSSSRPSSVMSMSVDDDDEPVHRGMSSTPQPESLSVTGWSPQPPESHPSFMRKPTDAHINIRQSSLESTNSLVHDAPPLQFRSLQQEPDDRRRSSTSTFTSIAPSFSTVDSEHSHQQPYRPSGMYRPSGFPEAIPERDSSSTESQRFHRQDTSLQVPTEAMSAFSLGPPSSPSLASPSFPPVSPHDRTTFSASSTLSLPPLAPPPVAGNYSRTLFGGLVTTAHRLTDLDGETGIFFFGHEVSVRSEGTFRLRFCLMKVGTARPNAPSPLLAEVLSDPFTVMSAKRFIGVLDTTELTRHFLKQGVKLPIRRKKAADAAGSDDDD